MPGLSLFTEVLLPIIFQGLIFYFFGRKILHQWIKYYRSHKSGVHTTGEVVDANSEKDAEGYDVFNATIQFADHDGVVRRFKTDFIFSRRPMSGMKALVIYNHSEPDEAYFHRRGDLFFLCLMSVLLLGSFVLITHYMVIRIQQFL